MTRITDPERLVTFLLEAINVLQRVSAVIALVSSGKAADLDRLIFQIEESVIPFIQERS